MMFALRLERYLYTKQYPLTCNDLLVAYDILPISVLYFMSNEKWDQDIINQREKILYSLHDEVRKILLGHYAHTE